MKQIIEGIVLIVLGIALILFRNYYIYFFILFIVFGGLKILFVFVKKKELIDLFNKNWVAVLIQSGIFLCILVSVIFTCHTINEQKNFHKNTLRPWVYCKPDSAQPIVVDTLGGIRINYHLRNIGDSPACSTKCYSTLTFHPVFPESEIKQKIKNDTNPRAIWLFPGENVKIVSNKIFLIEEEFLIRETGNMTAETVIVKSETLRENDVWDSLASRDFHVHTYIQFLDSHDDMFGFMTTFFLKCSLVDDTTVYMKVFGSHNSEKLIR